MKNWAGLLSPGIVSTFAVTIGIGAAASVLSAIIGTAIAIIVHRTDFLGNRTVSALVSLSFFLPSFILAMAWIIIGSPGGLINGWFELIGIEEAVDAYTATGIVFVMVLHEVPFVYLVCGSDPRHGRRSRKQRCAAGAAPHRVLFKITLPLLAYSLTSAVVLCFILSIEQFAIPAMMGIPGHVSVLATQLYLLVRFPPPDYGLAAAVDLRSAR